MTETKFEFKHIKYNARERYVDEFIGLRSAPDMLSLRLFPNGKEVTESMAAYNAARKYLFRWVKPTDRALCIAIGDGVSPRTGGLFAFMTKWDVISVDPVLSRYEMGSEINRLTIIPEKIQDANIDATSYGSNVVIIGVHSHHREEDLLSGIKFTIAHTIMIPCCVHQYPMSRHFNTYTDNGIWSPKNVVTVSFFAVSESVVPLRRYKNGEL